MKSEEGLEYRPVKSPMTDMEFRNYLDSDGHMVKPGEFRLSIYQGGTEPSLRRVVWRHLLNIFPESLSGRERFDYMKRKENEYFALREEWKSLLNKNELSDEVKHVMSLVKKDVLRTDRGHKYYAGGDESKNLIALYNLLVTYAVTHPDVSYCQGMSDIASPLLVVQKEEAQAYLCFCGLMKRLRTNFMYDGQAITTKLQHLSMLVNFYDPDFQMYMKEHGANDLFFCYRWLLLEMKREFPFDDALYMLEVMWSTLPPSPPETELSLKDDDYCPSLLSSLSPNSPNFGQKTQYAHLLSKRRLSNVVKNSAMSKSPKPVGAVSPRQTHLPQVVVDTPKKGQETITETDESSDSRNDHSSSSVENSSANVTDLCAKNSDNVLEKVTSDSVKTEDESENTSFGDHVKLENQAERKDIVNGELTSEKKLESDGSDHVNATSEETLSEKHVEKQTSDDSAKSENGSHDESSSEYNSAVVSLATSSPSASVLTNSSSFLSSSHSAERFPSLISGSLDEELEILSVNGGNNSVDNETENGIGVEGCNNSNTCFHNKNLLDIDQNGKKSSNANLKMCEDENDNQAQFYMSLEEPEKVEPKPVVSKKSDVPQIKGSFFSGMKRLLMSPERRPGKAQQVNLINNKNNANQSVQKSNSLGNIFSNNRKSDKNTSENDIDNDAEHTLFEVNRMIKSLNTDTKSLADSDSGNGSLTSSLNSANAQNGKPRSNSQASVHKLNSNSRPIEFLSDEQKKYFDKKYEEALRKVPVTEKALSGKQPSFCENHFGLDGFESARSEESNDVSDRDDKISECMEVLDLEESEVSRFKQLPPPDEFGFGNPFLMFACLTVLLQHRDIIMKTGMEYDELAMFFDKMVRKHNVNKVLHQARILYTEYIRMQQKIQNENTTEEDGSFSV